MSATPRWIASEKRLETKGQRKPRNSKLQAAQTMHWSGRLTSKAQKIITMRSSIKLEGATRKITLSFCNSSKHLLQWQAINKSIRKAQVDMQGMHQCQINLEGRMLNQEISKQTQLPLTDRTRRVKSMNLTKLQAEIVKLSLARQIRGLN